MVVVVCISGRYEGAYVDEHTNGVLFVLQSKIFITFIQICTRIDYRQQLPR